MMRSIRLALSVLIILAAVGGYVIYQQAGPMLRRMARLRRYWDHTQAHADWAIKAGQRCGDAPFVLPTDGYVGFLWGDRFRPGRRH
jgi:hypothetical protein